MAETINPGGSIIKYEGVYDWHKLYHLVVSWFKSRQFDFYETKHVKKPGPFGYEVEFESFAEREETAYVRYRVEFKVHAFHVEDIEVIENGEKKEKNKTGMMTIEIIPHMDLDWKKQDNGKSKWEQSELKKKARTFFHKHIIREKIEKWKDNIYYEAYQLQTKVKEELDLENKYSAYQWRKRSL